MKDPAYDGEIDDSGVLGTGVTNLYAEIALNRAIDLAAARLQNGTAVASDGIVGDAEAFYRFLIEADEVSSQ